MDDDIKQSIAAYPKVVAALMTRTPGSFEHRAALMKPLRELRSSTEHAEMVFPVKGLVDAILDIAADESLAGNADFIS